MVMNITLDVCGEPIVELSALRVAGEAHEECTYKIFDEKKNLIGTVKHHYDTGAEALAIIALNLYRGYKEQKKIAFETALAEVFGENKELFEELKHH